jgi:hypothetical protein
MAYSTLVVSSVTSLIDAELFHEKKKTIFFKNVNIHPKVTK